MLPQKRSLKLFVFFYTLIMGLLMVSQAQSTVDDVTELLT